MRSIVKYFIKNEIAGNILMILLFILGLVGLSQMKTTFFPEVESRLISIQAVYPGSSPEEIEEGIVSKIEENLKGLTGIERVTSVENLGRVMSFAIFGDVPLKTLKIISRRIENDLIAIDDLSKVTLTGFPEEEIEVTFREADLRSYNITFEEAASRIRKTNLELTGGTIKTEKEELLIRANNKEYTAKVLQDIVIKNNVNGGTVKLYQVADIADKWEDKPQRTYISGEPGVVIQVQNTLEEDMITIADNVRE